MAVKKFSVKSLTLNPRGVGRPIYCVLVQLDIQEMSWNIQAIPYKLELGFFPNTSPFVTSYMYNSPIYIVYIYKCQCYIRLHPLNGHSCTWWVAGLNILNSCIQTQITPSCHTRMCIRLFHSPWVQWRGIGMGVSRDRNVYPHNFPSPSCEISPNFILHTIGLYRHCSNFTISAYTQQP